MNKNQKQQFKLDQKSKKFKTGNQKVISQNLKRNMQMIVLQNKGADKSGNGSVTCHEPIDRKVPFSPYKFKHYKYNNMAAVDAPK